MPIDAFARREAAQRAKKRWAVVRKSVLPTKDEFMDKVNTGNTSWMAHWQKRRRPANIDSLMKHMRLNLRDHKTEIKHLFERFTAGKKYGRGPKERRKPDWRPAPKVSLVAILHMMEVELSREEVHELIYYFLDRTNTAAIHFHEFVWIVKSYYRMRAHHASKKKKEKDAAKVVPPSGEWKSQRGVTGGQCKIWVQTVKKNAEARKQRGSEAAVDEVMDKIRAVAKKNKNFNLKLAFEKFDADASGDIERHELQLVLREMGIELSDNELDLVFARFDPDGGGSIEYEEFVWVFMNRRALKKAAQGQANNLGLPKITATTKKEEADKMNSANNGVISKESLRLEHPVGRRSLANVHSQDSLKKRGGFQDLGNSKSTEFLPPLQLGEIEGGASTQIEKAKIKLGESGAMLKARILSAWCQSEGALPQDSVRVERAADICMKKIREIAMVDDTFDLKRAFKEFDIDGNGVVDKEEFVQAMRSFDDTLTPIECLAAYTRFDPNGDGVINYEEFAWTFFNRRTFSEATKKLKRRFTSQIIDRREAAQAKERIARQLEVFFGHPECAKVFKEFQNHECLHDITSLYACLFQLPLNFDRREVDLMLDQVRDSLRTTVSFPQFRQICKNQRRDCSVARLAIDENLGKFKNKGQLTKFNAPICRVNDQGENDEQTRGLLDLQKKILLTK
jgi:Ca2+-binding EF-hand superfamily protein